ncbi:ribokinase [Brachybacterium sp. AOP43-C2-M15]|uniref:ribokinase n=1 Tax=Brachybacterium sp. AOP43-C2-M15 TaxID=3457661 RepID=UPI004033EE7B
MSASSITVIGSVNVDDSVRVTRHPVPGETVSAHSLVTALGGKGANQAVASARASATVRFVGAFGRDSAPWILEALHADGIETEHLVQRDDVASGKAIVLVDDGGENSIIVVSGANHRIPDETVHGACSTLTAGDVILLQNEIPTATSRLAAQAARTAGATVVWNAAPAPESIEELITEVDLLIVNEHELAAIASVLAMPPSAVEAQIHAVAEHLDTDVVCTLGADGAAYKVGGASGRESARAVRAVDTTAAGDTFVGYLAAGLARRAPLSEQLRAASLAGSLAVTRPGAAASIPSLCEVTRTRNTERTTE